MQAMHYTPSGQGPAIIAVFATFMLVCTITVAVRIYVRLVLIRIFGPEDWFAILGWAGFVAHGGIAIMAILNGVGQHVEKIQPASVIPVGVKFVWICVLVFLFSSIAIRQSIVCMLLRYTIERSEKVVVYLVAGITILTNVAVAGFFVFGCTPVSYFWTRIDDLAGGKCLDQVTVSRIAYIQPSVSFVADLVMAILPWWMVRKLKLDLQKKTMVMITLGAGSIASLATVIRISYISRTRSFDDLLFNIANVMIWYCVESGLGLLASSAITFRPLVKSFGTRKQETSEPARFGIQHHRREKQNEDSAEMQLAADSTIYSGR